MLADSSATPIIIGVIAASAPFTLALFAAMIRFGRIEQKVDTLQLQVMQQQESQTRVLDAMLARLEQFGQRFSDHAIQDATHFGEMRGLLQGQVGVHKP